MSYNHLTISERVKIETLIHLGWTARAIASHLKRHHSTISRELKRMQSGYTADQAQQDYHVKRFNSKPQGCHTDEKIRYITDRLVATWSPEQIAERTRV